ncbi:MAG: Uma2 family endonuclease [Gemmataceae bacterium]
MPVSTTTPTPTFLTNASFRRFSVGEYHKLIDTGVLVDGEPYELLEGYLVLKMSRGTPHDEAMDFLDAVLMPLIPANWYVRSQRSITLSDSEPEPDYAVVRGRRMHNRGHHPLATELGLVIEVSDSSLPIDRTDKARIYARAGIPVYWIVNVQDKVVEVLTLPSGPCELPAYAQRDEYPIGTSVPVVLDGNTVGSIAVADIMG